MDLLVLRRTSKPLEGDRDERRRVPSIGQDLKEQRPDRRGGGKERSAGGPDTETTCECACIA
eukprot:scaffold2846_cov322-Pavlova_lutheri.AAC.1